WILCAVIFYAPALNGYFLEHANFVEANPLKTPEHIAPVWYFGAFYAMLRAITFDIGFIEAKLGGVITMGAAIAILFVLPWLDRSPVKSWRYKGIISRTGIVVFAFVFMILTWLGTQPATELYTLIAQICTLIYFAFFLLMPFYTRWEKTKPVPERVTG
ncbi:MAG: cytochrome b, partial [Endozoicomonas sp.]